MSGIAAHQPRSLSAGRWMQHRRRTDADRTYLSAAKGAGLTALSFPYEEAGVVQGNRRLLHRERFHLLPGEQKRSQSRVPHYSHREGMLQKLHGLPPGAACEDPIPLQVPSFLPPHQRRSSRKMRWHWKMPRRTRTKLKFPQHSPRSPRSAHPSVQSPHPCQLRLHNQSQALPLQPKAEGARTGLPHEDKRCSFVACLEQKILANGSDTSRGECNAGKNHGNCRHCSLWLRCPCRKCCAVRHLTGNLSYHSHGLRSLAARTVLDHIDPRAPWPASSMLPRGRPGGFTGDESRLLPEMRNDCQGKLV